MVCTSRLSVDEQCQELCPAQLGFSLVSSAAVDYSEGLGIIPYSGLVPLLLSGDFDSRLNAIALINRYIQSSSKVNSLLYLARSS